MLQLNKDQYAKSFLSSSDRYSVNLASFFTILHIKLKLYVRVQLVKVYTNLPPNWHAYALKPEKDFRKVKTPTKVSWIRVPVMMISVARKLSTLEERYQNQSCLFRRGEYRNKGHNPVKVSWVRVLVMVYLCIEN
jgi:hypothetical protein